MPRLLIQCQGSPGPLSFKITPSLCSRILQQYHHVTGRMVISITDDIGETYYINLALVSWICMAVDEPCVVVDEPEPEYPNVAHR